MRRPVYKDELGPYIQVGAIITGGIDTTVRLKVVDKTCKYGDVYEYECRDMRTGGFQTIMSYYNYKEVK